jgi:ATPase subunit of ABC transporter with duplicated ATPase domains
VEDMKGRTKICFYKEPNELFGRLRDDVTAVVSETFHRAERLEVSLKASAKGEIERIIPTGTSLIVRSAVQKTVLSALDLGNVVQVVGPKGIGKTVLLASLAEENMFTFVPASGLHRNRLLATFSILSTPNKHLVPWSTSGRPPLPSQSC